MKMVRVISAALLVSLSISTTWVGADNGPAKTDSKDRIMHVLNRLTFGPRPGDFEEIQSIGIGNFITKQLNPATYPQASQVNAYLASHESLRMNPAELFINFEMPLMEARKKNKDSEDKKNSEFRKVVAETRGKIYADTTGEHLIRAVYSPRQLEEVMTDFWFNHFNVSKDKGLGHVWVGHFEDNAIRPNVFGKFRTLLGATCHHPAMLFYLDNWQNSIPGAQFAGRQQDDKGPKLGINENYARELMELHTLGVNGGYTQKDVISLAHILTGLSIPNRRDYRRKTDLTNVAYHFYPERHDYGTKILLGKRINGNGEQEIEQALDLLANSPATAHHISYKLSQYFIADDPPKAVVDACAATFQSTGGDIKAVLKTLFSRSEFWDPKYEQAKFKSPQRFLISLLRAAEVQTNNYEPVLGFLKQSGEPLYGCVTPDGYKNTKDAWLNPDGLLKRISLATALSNGRLPGAHGYVPDPVRVMSAVKEELKPNTIALFNQTPEQLQTGLLLGSPEFMKY